MLRSESIFLSEGFGFIALPCLPAVLGALRPMLVALDLSGSSLVLVWLIVLRILVLSKLFGLSSNCYDSSMVTSSGDLPFMRFMSGTLG